MNIIFIGTHMDDIELTMLGTLLKFQKEGHKIFYLVISDCQDMDRNKYLTKEHQKIMKELKPDYFNIHSIDNKQMSKTENRELIRGFLEFHRDSNPIDMVFGPWKEDVHQDHQAVAEEMIRVFRYYTVLQSELPHSCQGFKPDYYVQLSKDIVEKKLELISYYKSQSNMIYWDPENIKSTMKFRGLQCNVEYAEAFKIWKMIQ